MLKQVAKDVQQVPWLDQEPTDTEPYREGFLSHFRRNWKADQHVSLIGPTGGGKTTLALQIIDRRANTVILATKPEDKTMNRLLKDRSRGYKRMTKWDPHVLDKRIVLWPPLRDLDKDTDVQRRVMQQALKQIFAEGRRCVMADELRYLCDKLRCRNYFEMIWLQGRSIKIPLVAIGQRPAWLPREIYSQADHLFFWRTQDEDDLKSIGGCGASNSRQIRELVAELPLHEVLYLNTRNGTLLRTKVEL
jgi:hypothetical protein